MSKTLRDYFNGVADLLANRSCLGGDSAENTDIGTNRETVVQEFLQKHVPKRFAINMGGDVFGVGGTRSGQIDILINHDMSINFLENHKICCPVESVAAAVSVKSRLTKDEIYSALENLASIPQPHPSVITLNPLKAPVAAYILSWPSLFVFAFDGIDSEKCVKHMTEFYAEHQVPFNRIPRCIIVNRKYQIIFLHYNALNATVEKRFDARHLQLGKLNAEGRGAPLFWMMHEIAKGLSWLDGMYLDYGAYYSEVYGP